MTFRPASSVLYVYAARTGRCRLRQSGAYDGGQQMNAHRVYHTAAAVTVGLFALGGAIASGLFGLLVNLVLGYAVWRATEYAGHRKWRDAYWADPDPQES